MCKVRLRMITPPAVCLPRAMDAGGRVGAAARSGASRSGLDGVAARAHARVECLAALLLALRSGLLLGLPPLLPLLCAPHDHACRRCSLRLVLAVFLLYVAVEPVIGFVLVAAYLCPNGPGGGADGGPFQSTALRRRCRGSGL